MSQSDEENLIQVLYPRGSESILDEQSKILLEQYKVFVETSEKLVARRQSLNTFFLSINALILSLMGVAAKYLDEVNGWMSSEGTIAILLSNGIVFCIIWLMQINSIKQLNEAKFRVIHLLEQQLPASVFKAEWYALDEGKDPKIYTAFTKTVKRIPIGFIFLYFMGLIFLIPFFYEIYG